MFTDPDYREDYDVYGDATFLGLADRPADILADPQDTDVLSRIDLFPITVQPIDLPAALPPESEPDAADLRAVETLSDAAVDARIALSNTLAAYKARVDELRRECDALAHRLDDHDLERAA
ncbi:hypothetical protein [Amycolatopsis sp. NPDC004079]|uniref:hypothetical protein n=1 Tax=Amycolatopsis sp. NPDC004079 TaxID=3154549 RepID=UPI0033AE9CFD